MSAAAGPLLKTVAEEEEEEEERRRRRAREKRVIPCMANTLRLGEGPQRTDEIGKRRHVPGFVPEKDGEKDIGGESCAEGFDGKWEVQKDETAQGPSRPVGSRESKGGETNEDHHGNGDSASLHGKCVTYGLTVMPKTKRSQSKEVNPPTAAAPAAERAAPLASSLLTFDIDSLPDDQLNDVQAYEEMPVEEFGAALLRGMGWKDGQEVVDRSGREVKPIMYVARPQQLGLGADPAPPPPPPSHGSKRDFGVNRETQGNTDHVNRLKGKPKQDFMYVAPRDEDGKVRHVVSIDEKLVKKKLTSDAVEKGKRMFIVGGRHRDLSCVVESLDLERKRCRVRLEPSGEYVDVDAKNLAGKAPPKRVRDGDGPASGEGDTHKKCRTESVRRPWIRENIRVRVVDKRTHDGGIYLKKAVIIDVPGPGAECTLRIDGLGLVHNVAQSSLETVVPRDEGALLIVVRGNHRGEVCKLVHRNTSKGYANVKFVSDFSFKSFDLDDIAEWTGDVLL